MTPSITPGGEAGTVAARWSTRLPVGVREGREIAFDLATVHGLGIDGAGAAAAVRGVTVNALGVNLVAGTPDISDAPPLLTVLVTAADLADLLDHQHLPTALPAGLQVRDTLEEALELAEATIRARTTTTTATADVVDPMPGSTLLLVTAQPSGSLAARLQAVLVTGQPCGVVGVVWGDWRGGGCVHADADGLVWAADRGPGDGLRGVRLFGLGAAEVPDLLALLGSVEPGPPTLTPSPSDAWPESTWPDSSATTGSRRAADEGRGGENATSLGPPWPATGGTPEDADTDQAAAAPAERGDPDEPSRDGEDIAEQIAEALNPCAGRAPAAPGPLSARAHGVVPLADASHDTTASRDTAASHDTAGPAVPAAAAPGPDGNGDAVERDAADTRPAPDAGRDTSPGGDDAIADAAGRSAPITLRILGRPMLLVEACSAAHRQPSRAAGDGGDGVDSTGAVEATGVEVAATLSARMQDLRCAP